MGNTVLNIHYVIQIIWLHVTKVNLGHPALVTASLMPRPWLLPLYKPVWWSKLNYLALFLECGMDQWVGRICNYCGIGYGTIKWWRLDLLSRFGSSLDEVAVDFASYPGYEATSWLCLFMLLKVWMTWWENGKLKINPSHFRGWNKTSNIQLACSLLHP